MKHKEKPDDVHQATNTKYGWLRLLRTSLQTLLTTVILSSLSGCYVPPNGGNISPSSFREASNRIEIQTPTLGWELQPTALYRTSEGDYLFVATLVKPDGMAAQAISSVSCEIEFQHPDSSEPRISKFVIGKTWNWGEYPGVTFIDSREEIKDALADAQSVPFTTS